MKFELFLISSEENAHKEIGFKDQMSQKRMEKGRKDMIVGKIANRDNIGEKSIIEKKNIYDLSRGRFKMDTYEMHVQRGENKLCLIHDKWKITSLDLAKSKKFGVWQSPKICPV